MEARPRRGVVLNHQNQWRFHTPVVHAYRFAFEDWRMDGYRVPHAAD